MSIRSKKIFVGSAVEDLTTAFAKGACYFLTVATSSEWRAVFSDEVLTFCFDGLRLRCFLVDA